MLHSLEESHALVRANLREVPDRVWTAQLLKAYGRPLGLEVLESDAALIIRAIQPGGVVAESASGASHTHSCEQTCARYRTASGRRSS